jgi:hypothetical protein
MRTAVSTSSIISWLAVGALATMLVSCGHASVEIQQVYHGQALPRPAIILVRDFVVAPTDVELDSGRIARLRRILSGSNDAQQQTAAAQSVVDALSNSLVEEIDKMGLTAQRVAANTDIGTPQTAALIDGNVLSIDEGNRAKRVAIGFGAGASEVKASVALSYLAPQTAARQLAQFHAEGSSGYAPGMLATGGASAAVGAGSTLAVSGGTQALRETNGATVSSDADNISKKIADQLKPIFIAQGWLAAN